MSKPTKQGHLEFMGIGARTGATSPTIIMVGRKWRSRYRSVTCIGNKGHYRKDGSCIHTERLIEILKPEIRRTVRVDPFGGNVELRSERSA